MNNDETPNERTPEALQEAADDLMVIIGRFQGLNAGEPTRSRELSVAITHLETGLLWAKHAAMQG